MTTKNNYQFLVSLILTICFLDFCKAQIVEQDSLLKSLGVDEIIYTKDVYFDKVYKYTAPVIFGYDSLNTFGKPFASRRYKEGCVLSSENIYTEDGLLIDKTVYNSKFEEPVFGRELEYDSNGLLKHSYEFGIGNVHESTKSYEYDQKNRLIKRIIASADSDYKSSRTFHYKGNLIDKIDNFNNGKMHYSIIHKYDKKLNLIKIYYDYKGEIRNTIFFEYDNFNRLKRKKYDGFLLMTLSKVLVHISEINFKDIIELSYTYYNNGLLESQTEYKNGKAIARLNYKYIYYDRL